MTKDNHLIEHCLNRTHLSDFYPFPAEEGEFGLMSPVGDDRDADNHLPPHNDAYDADDENSMPRCQSITTATGTTTTTTVQGVTEDEESSMESGASSSITWDTEDD